MILIRLTTEKLEQIEEIAELLLKEHLILDINVKHKVERWNLVLNEIVKKNIHLLTGKTRANLFPKIDALLREKYPETMPEIYSLPIVHMDWEQADQLQKFIPPNP